MKVLILSCNTGEGHNSCAKAIKDCFDTHGCECTVEDAMAYVSPAFSRLISVGHVFIYRHIPHLFSGGYNSAEKHVPSDKSRMHILSLLASAGKKLAEIIDSQYDTVVCTHVFSVMLFTEAMTFCRTRPASAFVATDYTCSPIAETGRLDFYFIPAAELADEFVSKGIDRDRLIVSGLPVRCEFYTSLAKPAAKAAEGIAADRRHLLIMCGSMGCGPMEKLCAKISALLGEEGELTMICGTNRKLFLKMEKKYRSRPNVHIRGYVNNISLLMDSADLYLTKPGGISVSEAKVKALPMVFVDAVAGCEAHNMRYFTDKGAATCPADIGELAETCVSLLNDPERLTQMSRSFGPDHDINSAELIYSTLAEESQKRGT